MIGSFNYEGCDPLQRCHSSEDGIQCDTGTVAHLCKGPAADEISIVQHQQDSLQEGHTEWRKAPRYRS